MERAVLVYTTWPWIVEAERAGRAIVEKRACRLRQCGTGNDLALLVGGKDRTRRRGGDAGQDARLTRRSGARGGQTGAQLYHAGRSEERRVGKECRSRWSPDH